MMTCNIVSNSTLKITLHSFLFDGSTFCSVFHGQNLWQQSGASDTLLPPGTGSAAQYHWSPGLLSCHCLCRRVCSPSNAKASGFLSHWVQGSSCRSYRVSQRSKGVTNYKTHKPKRLVLAPEDSNSNTEQLYKSHQKQGSGFCCDLSCHCPCLWLANMGYCRRLLLMSVSFVFPIGSGPHGLGCMEKLPGPVSGAQRVLPRSPACSYMRLFWAPWGP